MLLDELCCAIVKVVIPVVVGLNNRPVGLVLGRD